MAVESLAVSQGANGSAGGLQGLPVELNQAGVAHEGLHAERSSKPSRARGRQGVVRAGEVVAHGLRGPGPHEDRSGLLDLFGQGLRLLHLQFQVLGGKAVAELRGLVQVAADHDQAPVVEGLAGDGGAGMSLQLLLNRAGNGLRELLAGGQQDGRRQGVVLRLSQEIGRDMLGVGAGIGNHQHFAGARQGIDRDPPVDRFFGQGHIEIARTANDVHPRDGFRAVGQRSDGLGATDPIDLVDAREVRGGQDGGVDATVGTGRGDHDHPLHSSHLRGNGVHQHRARVAGTASGHVQTGALHRPPAPA